MTAPTAGTATLTFEADRDHNTQCEAPYVYMPEHRWRVDEPSEGGVAGNVRAVFEESSKTILVGGVVALLHHTAGRGQFVYAAAHRPLFAAG